MMIKRLADTTINKWLVLVFLIGAAQPLHAKPEAQPSAVEQRLLQNIETSQKSLKTLEKEMLNKSLAYSNSLSSLQDELVLLRAKAASARRLADEQTLTIKQLNKRLKEWKDQDAYQHHLLTNFVSSVAAPITDVEAANKDVASALSVMTQQLDHLGDASYPTWGTQEIVGASGIVQEADVLRIGPVKFYLQEKNRSAGLLVEKTDGQAPKAFELPGNSFAELSTLKAQGTGLVQFDPTLGRAIQVIEEREGAVEHISKGGVWAIPILFFAFIALLIAIIKCIELVRLPKIVPLVVERVIKIVEENKADLDAALRNVVSTTAGAQNQLLSIALTTHASEKRDDLLIAFLMDYRHKLEKLIGVIAITASIAPLLGLLGTVSGMIETFKMMTIFGAGDPSAVSGGISEALVTTELGLIVAIPALVLNALLSRKIKSYLHHLESMAIKLSKLEFQVKVS